MRQFSYTEAKNYLDALVQDSLGSQYKAGFALERVKYALGLLGNPQEQFKSIHIAGTSGKSSTAAWISQLLVAHGFNTGLTLSPHIASIRERVQLNNLPITAELFAKHFSELFPILRKMDATKFGSLSYFETLICLAYFTFLQTQIDYAVIETGLGGTYDATNTIMRSDKLAVIGRIGYDHTHILGNTIAEIAQNKAGIIQPGQHVLLLSENEIVDKVVLDRAHEVSAHVHKFRLNESLSIDDFNFKQLNLEHLPSYQVENLKFALAALNFIVKRDGFAISKQKVQACVDNFYITGRFEYKKINGKTYLLDGAHNPQKIRALVNSLAEKYPERKFTFIVAVKAGKDSEDILRQLIPVSSKIILTGFSVTEDLVHKSISPEDLAQVLRKNGFEDFVITKNVVAALAEAKTVKSSNPVVVTGSLYLIAEILNDSQIREPL